VGLAFMGALLQPDFDNATGRFPRPNSSLIDTASPAHWGWLLAGKRLSA
jgi:hypothetical protein